MSSGAQMLAGGLMLTAASSVFGEFRDFHPAAVSTQAWISLLYLIVFGSVIAFTAYLWLIHHESPTKVGTYAYVNPVVAVTLGYFFGGEELGLRTVLGTVFVLVSVIVIATAPASAQRQSLLRTSPGLDRAKMRSFVKGYRRLNSLAGFGEESGLKGDEEA